MGHTVQLTSQIQLTKYDCIIPILAPLRNKWIWLIILHTRFPRNRFKIQTLSLWFRLFDHQNVLLYVYLIMSSLPSSKVHNWLCPSHCPQISMSGPAPWFDKSRLILAFGTEILEIQWVMFRNWTRQNNLPKVLIASLLPPNVPDVFFLKRDNLGSIRRAPILYTSIHSGLKTPDGPSVVLPIKHPLRFIRDAVMGTQDTDYLPSDLTLHYQNIQWLLPRLSACHLITFQCDVRWLLFSPDRSRTQDVFSTLVSL